MTSNAKLRPSLPKNAKRELYIEQVKSYWVLISFVISVLTTLVPFIAYDLFNVDFEAGIAATMLVIGGSALFLTRIVVLMGFLATLIGSIKMLIRKTPD